MFAVKAIDTLYDEEYTIRVVNCLKGYWRTQNSFSCIGTPKDRNMFLYLDGCKAEYTLKNGSKLLAESGDIVYTPMGSEYTVRFYDFETRHSKTYGTNFFLFDREGRPFTLSDQVRIFSTNDSNYKVLFSKVNSYSEVAIPCPMKMKAAMYDIFGNLCMHYRNKSLNEKKFSIISRGITYLESDTEQKLSIAQIARMCNVSECYFRKMFREYSGLSPADYRINHKLSRAKAYLRHENLTVSEISDLLGFTNTAYFTKQFRIRTGMTPSEYRKRQQY